MVAIEWVELRDFRGYMRGEAEFGPGLTVLHGANGAGKTNLVEALYFGCTARPMLTVHERELVRFGAESTRVVVRTIGDDGPHELSVALKPGELKRMRVDGVVVERLMDAEARPRLCVFVPDRLGLINGAPVGRRAHMDQVVAAMWPTRTGDRQAYSRVLLQRNALLAGIRGGVRSRDTISTWDMELARHACALRRHRAEATDLLSGPFQRRAREFGLGADVTLKYRPRSHADDVEAFVAELRERLTSDLERGFSTHGPHRDELGLQCDGRDLRAYGSQGERRLALLALLLAERDVLGDRRTHLPVMLLDDVMSELDPDRRELLVAVLLEGGQSVITTTDLRHVPHSSDTRVQKLEIPGGVIQHHAPVISSATSTIDEVAADLASAERASSVADIHELEVAL